MSNSSNDFLREFIKDRKKIGSAWPSSKYLRKKMLKNIDFESSKVIVEYGAGTGVFTREVLSQMTVDSLLIVFELNDYFYTQLTEEFKNSPNVIIIKDSAENVMHHLRQHTDNDVDVVLSSLPLNNFNDELTSNILEAAKEVLGTKGKFIQFQYTLNAKKILQEIFNLTSIQFTPMNIPPAFVYTCQKK